MIDCIDCGVIQGHKLSGFFYTIYTNEVPILQEELKDEEIYETIGAKHYAELPVKHDVLNFVDDSNSVITADPGVDIEEYTRNYFKLLEIYYNSQKLKINTDKTQLMVCTMPRFMNQIENIEIETPEYTDNVKPQEQIKILGYLFNTRRNIDNQVKLKSACHAIMHIAYKHRTIMPQAA